MLPAPRSTIAMSPSKGRASLEDVLLSEVIASIVQEERSGDRLCVRSQDGCLDTEIVVRSILGGPD